MQRTGDTLPGVGTGAYSHAEAAALLHVTTGRIKSWAEGYTYNVLDGKKQAKPALQRSLYIAGLLTFKDLVELWWVKSFVDNKFSLQYVKATAERLADVLQTEYPFAHARMTQSDGVHLLVEAMDGGLIVAKTGQTVMPIPSDWIKTLHFDKDTQLANAWNVPGYEQIILDSRRSFGAPIVQKVGIRTDVLYTSYLAEGGNPEAIKEVADWYEIAEADVSVAVRFEENWIRAVA
jgi:hypothetical protein